MFFNALNQNNMKQTAVEWLAEQITTVKWKMSDVTDRNSIIEQAKAMEKEQIINSYTMGSYDMAEKEFRPEQYYRCIFDAF